MRRKLMIRVGFTGTRQGMTEQQQEAIESIVQVLGTVGEFHHGDCVGADTQAHDIVARVLPDCSLIVHPPFSVKRRANRSIVDNSRILLATPGTDKEEGRRSGTWATIRYAKKEQRGKRDVQRRIYIIYPDGRREVH
jgi:hypothetical protein